MGPATEPPHKHHTNPALNMGVVRLSNNRWAVGDWYKDLANALRTAAGGQ